MEKSAEAGVESPQISCPSDQQLTTDGVNPATEKSTEAHQSEAEEDSHWITGRKLLAIMVCITAVLFLVFLDTAIISTAIPKITDEFHSLHDVGWYGSGFQLPSAAIQPLTGKIYSKFRNKWTFLSFFLLFEIGSVICGAATSSTMLIVGRAVAGMGSAGLLTGGLIIISACVPLHRRPVLVGGALTEYTTWRWCFYINVPIGAVVVLFMIFVVIPDGSVKAGPLTVLRSIHRELDLVGFALLAPAVIQLLLALQYGGNQFSWNSSQVIGLFCGAGATGLVFCAWLLHRGDEALIPPSLAGTSAVWSASLTQTSLFTTVFLAAYFIPIYFQTVKGASPLLSGVYMLPAIFAQLLGAVLSGAMVQRTGYVIPYALAASALTAIGNGLLALYSPSTSVGKWVGYQLIAGLGRGLGLQMSLLAVQTALQQSLVPVATSLVIFVQTLGTAVFLAVSNTLFDQSLVSELSVNAPNVDPTQVIAAGATGFRGHVNVEDIPGILLSYSNSIDRVFYIAAALGAVAFVTSNFLGWIDLRSKKPVAAGTVEA
ncbi:major facilitator superfamily domain-containing protein [Trichoderma breve]|uniref:Major facilitator superfamily domain-containing protein n=1 Tax=Trichoderma breve TaxID=2034170 RepID=A0A9W9BHW5_9HYPO|nr:major facilitator superfamily domain-containing protein [Trichoderma breve]KAJ4860086.1 major facilitator superfamily domain-containing protein [Trichoderma breve]